MEKHSSSITTTTGDESCVQALLDRRGSISSSEDELELSAMRRASPYWLRRNRWSILFNAVLLVVNLIFCIGWVRWSLSHAHPLTETQPAWDVTTYEGRQFDLRPAYLENGTLNPKKPPHNGRPTPELAGAWEGLVKHQNIRLQKDEFRPFANDESLVELADGSGYYGTLAVFHALHCEKRLHHYLYRDSYYPDLDDDGDIRLLYHTEYCLDWLRQYVQCNADTTLIPFYWGTKQPHPLAMDRAQHQCVSWEPLEQWMAQHSFDAFEPGLLMHPVYGSPFKEGKVNRIGIAVKDYVLHSSPTGS